MRAKKITGLLLLLILAVAGVAQTKDAILGKWVNESGEGQILIYKNGDKYFGKLAWLNEPNNKNGLPKQDANKNKKLHKKTDPRITSGDLYFIKRVVIPNIPTPLNQFLNYF